jgi:hypothetical protein
MADIPVEKKDEGGGLMPWLLGLLVFAFLGWGLWTLLSADDAEPGADDETVAVQTEAPAEPDEPPAPDTTADAREPTLGAILGNPSTYIGDAVPRLEATTPEVPTDRGFWIEDDGERLLAILIDQPREEPIDINPGQRLRVTGGTLRAPRDLGQIPGVPLDADTQRLAEQQDIFLVVDERNVEILERPQ